MDGADFGWNDALSPRSESAHGTRPRLMAHRFVGDDLGCRAKSPSADQSDPNMMRLPPGEFLGRTQQQWQCQGVVYRIVRSVEVEGTVLGGLASGVPTFLVSDVSATAEWYARAELRRSYIGGPR